VYLVLGLLTVIKPILVRYPDGANPVIIVVLNAVTLLAILISCKMFFKMLLRDVPCTIASCSL
jgi:fumarate reductase subunit C